MTTPADDSIEIRARHLVGENTKFKIYFEHLVDHISGDVVPKFLIVEPKDKKPSGVTGVAILPMSDDKVGLIRIYRPPIKTYCYEIPHGFTEPNESEDVAARRELMEEAGLEVESIEDLGIVMPDSGIVAARVRMFAAFVSNVRFGQTLEAGLREFMWIPIARFEEMLSNSEIQDSYTLSAWCRYLINKKKMLNRR